MKFQEKHHGIKIPAEQQPTCPQCSGGMSLSISYPNDKCYAEWYCLDNCEAIITFTDWLNNFPVSDTIRDYFSTVGMPYSEVLEASLIEKGYKKVGGHRWGGGFWGEAVGEKYWTGYKGQAMEYWLPSKAKRSKK